MRFLAGPWRRPLKYSGGARRAPALIPEANTEAARDIPENLSCHAVRLSLPGSLRMKFVVVADLSSGRFERSFRVRPVAPLHPCATQAVYPSALRIGLAALCVKRAVSESRRPA
jgi:hypothetical protein